MSDRRSPESARAKFPTSVGVVQLLAKSSSKVPLHEYGSPDKIYLLSFMVTSVGDSQIKKPE